jgi:hypothetical protein
LKYWPPDKLDPIKPGIFVETKEIRDRFQLSRYGATFFISLCSAGPDHQFQIVT